MYWLQNIAPLGFRRFLVAGVILMSASPCGAEDWPQFRGPSHDGISRESNWRKNWDSAPPKVRWRSEVGIGFSAVSVGAGRVVTVGHQGDEDVIHCLDEVTGKSQWVHRYSSDLGAMFYIGGPGSTPTIDVDEKRVYVLGKWGEVFCFQLSDGSLIWQRQLAQEENLAVPDWGYNGSPLLMDDQVILNIGRAGMALNSANGKTIWRSEGDECGYSTPLPFIQDGKEMVAVSSGEAYLGVERKTGRELWSIPWFTRYGVNAADPIIWKGQVFVTSGYQKGAGLFTLGGSAPQEVWKQRRFRAQQNAPVRIGDHLYGFDGDSSSRAMLKCVAWKTGEVSWEDETFGYGALSAADGFLIVLGGNGRLGLVPVDPSNCRPTVVASGLEADCWTVPVLANGRILCRNSKGSLVSLDVSQ